MTTIRINSPTNDPFETTRLPVEETSLDDLKPYKKNNKKHSDEHVAKLKRSITEQGLLEPIVVDKEGVIISGHGRYAALKLLREESPKSYKTIPVKWARHLSKLEAAAARIAHNKLSSTEYDADAMMSELLMLSENDIDLSIIGIEDKEISAVLGEMAEMDDSTVVEDLSIELENHEAGAAETIEEIDHSNTPLAKILGFSKVPTKDAKTVQRFIALIEKKHKKMGVDALLEHMKDTVYGR